MGFDGLAVLVLEHESLRAVQHAGASAFDGCRVARGVDPVAGRFDAVELDAFVVQERVEHPDRVRAAADACEDRIRQPADLVEQLRARLFPDDLLEIADHRRERMRSRGRAEDVVGRLDARDPVAICVVDRVLECPGTRRDGDHLGAEQTHAGDVERLALSVDLAHVDHALEAEQRGRGGGGHAVLACPGLGDHARLAEPLGQQRLSENVVDLVRTGVVEVFALEEDPSAARVGGEARHFGERRGPSGVRVEKSAQLELERGVGHRLFVDRRELVDRGDERFRHVPPAELAEVGSGCFAQAHEPASRKAVRVATGSPVTRASPMRTTSAPADR